MVIASKSAMTILFLSISKYAAVILSTFRLRCNKTFLGAQFIRDSWKNHVDDFSECYERPTKLSTDEGLDDFTTRR